MEIKATLQKPYTEEARVNFIVEQNHRLGYEIRESETALEAWGYTEEEILAEKKQAKFDENTSKAKEAITNGYVPYKDAKFETDTTTCSDLTSTSLIMQTSGIETWEWVTKDDKVLTLKLEDFANIGALIAQYKNQVWNVKYVGYKTQIEEAETIEEVEAIVIDYDVPELNSTGEASDTSSNPPVYTEETTDTEEITGTEETIGIEEITGTEETIGIEEITGTEETISIEEITGTEEATNSEKNIE